MLTICHLQRVSTSHSPTSIVAGSIHFLVDTGVLSKGSLNSPDCKLRCERARISRRRQAAQDRSINPASWGVRSNEDPFEGLPTIWREGGLG